MGIDERLVLFGIGCVLGFILGYIVRTLKDIKEEVDDIDKCVHECQKRIRDERGAMKIPNMRSVALFLVVALTFFAAIQSQRASNKSNETSQQIIQLQAAQKQNLDCTTQVLFDAIRALNERTTYTGAQTDANIALVQAQLDLLTKSQQPDLTDAEGQALFDTYVAQVQEFIDLATKTRDQQDQFPYPTVQDLTDCLAQTNAETAEPEGSN